MALLASPLADAGLFEMHARVSAPAEPVQVRILERGSSATALVLGQRQSWAINPKNGEILQTWSLGGEDAAAVDVTGDRLRDLVLCQHGGLVALPWESSLLQEPILLDLEA